MGQMTTNREVMNEISRLSENIDKLSIRFDNLINNGSIALSELEAASAKIISDLSEKIEIISKEKDIRHTCPCNQEILEQIKNLSTQQTKSRPDYSGLKKYSYPNWNVGNASLGSSGNPKALTWPPRKTES